MSSEKRTGYEQVVGRFRGKASDFNIELDRSPMIQELVARLRFTAEQISMDHKNILDYGCGTGAGLAWVQSHKRPGKCTGLDVSQGAIDYAKRHYPGIDFRVHDILSAHENLGREFDLALCFEVIEHIDDPDGAVKLLAKHYLKPEGVLAISTPNRMVFSAGAEVSPTNRTHIYEMDLREFRVLLKRHFANVRIWGMRFKDPVWMQAHARMVRHACDGYKLFGEWWWNLALSRFYHMFLRGEVLDFILGRHVAFTKASHFEYVDREDQVKECIWFFALCRSQIG